MTRGQVAVVAAVVAAALIAVQWADIERYRRILMM